MTGRSNLEQFLHTDPRDAGCGHTFDVLDRVAELERAGGDIAYGFPGVAIHLALCGPCAEDLRGLMVLAG
jgi:hypothetical protein